MKPAVPETNPMLSFEDFTSTIENFKDHYANDISDRFYFGFPITAILDIEGRLISEGVRSVAYFSMEYGIAPSIYNSFRLTVR